MRCPYCGANNTEVVDSRERIGVAHDDISYDIKCRIRRCRECGIRFSTREIYPFEEDEKNYLENVWPNIKDSVAEKIRKKKH